MELERSQRRDPVARAIWWSSALHVGLLVLFVAKENILPSSPKVVPPTLRVDIVGLPDVVKKDLQLIKPAPPAAEEPKAPPAPAPEPEAPPAPDEMALKPKEKVKEKPKPKPEEKVVEKPRPEADKKEREKKISNALSRIRALERLKDEAADDAADESVVIRGNQISRGSSLSGEAKESLEASYYDQIRSALSANWTIPAWLTRQKYAAQVQITVNEQGAITGIRFIKASGNDQFDAEVRNTLKASEPLPKPPKDLASSVASRGILVGFPL